MTLSAFIELAKKDYPTVLLSDIELIIAEVLQIHHLDFYLYQERILTKTEIAKIDLMLQARSDNRPLQYIFGYTEFRNLSIEVGDGVLIPRPETEMLVDISVELLDSVKAPKVCDIGTGSGIIALSIAQEVSDSEVIGIDISREALKYAENNKLKNKIGNVDFMYGDLFSPYDKSVSPPQFDLITANLPYVSEILFEVLPDEVASYEPESALLSGSDGLDLIRKIIPQAKKYIKGNGHIILEFSPEQDDEIKLLLNQNNYRDVQIVKDLTGKERFAVAKS